MGVGVGDTLTINVLGSDVEARIANLRAIDWTSLGINFAIIFAPGTIELAPHTFIATAVVAPGFDTAVEKAVTDKFPNVSAISVREALATVEEVLGHIVTAARATAAITLLAGTLVLAGAVFATHRRRVYDAVVLKVLGARRRNIIAAFLIEFGLVGLATSAIAAVVGTLCAYAFDRYLRLDFAFLPQEVLGTAFFATVAIIVLGLAGTWRALAQRPAPLLRNA
jgi:putative ABC transport system permease protein